MRGVKQLCQSGLRFTYRLSNPNPFQLIKALAGSNKSDGLGVVDMCASQ